MVSRYPKPGNKTVSNLTRVAGVGPDRRNKSKTKTVRGSTKHRSRSEELKPEPHMVAGSVAAHRWWSSRGWRCGQQHDDRKPLAAWQETDDCDRDPQEGGS